MAEKREEEILRGVDIVITTSEVAPVNHPLLWARLFADDGPDCA